MKKRDIILLIGLTYTIGETLQLFLLGPNWARWYLSDFGFVLWYAGILNIYILKKNLKNCLFISFASAVVLEFIQFLQGKGDYIDILCYIAGFLFGLLVVLTKTEDKDGVNSKVSDICT